MTQLPLRAQLASALGRSAATLSRMTGRGDGSVIGGRVGLMLEPDLLRQLARDRKLALVSATNGKTTTTRLITSALLRLGRWPPTRSAPTCPPGTSPRSPQQQGRPLRRAGGGREIPPGGPRHHRRQRRLPDEPQPRPDGPRRRDLAAGAEVAQGPVGQAHPRHRQLRRPARHLGRLHRGQGHLGRRRPALEGRLLELPRVRRAAGAQGRRLGLPRVHLPPARAASGSSTTTRSSTRAASGGCSTSSSPAWPTAPTPRWRWPWPRRSACRSIRRCPACARSPRSPAATPRSSGTAARRGCCWPRTRPAGWRRSTSRDPSLPIILSVNAQGPDGRDTSWLWDVDYRILRGRPVFVTGERRLDLALRLDVADVPFTSATASTRRLAMRRRAAST